VLASDRTTASWAAVIVNYNAGDHLVACVRSVLADAQSAPETSAVDIVVVDNGSTDGSLDAVRLDGIARVVRSPGNVGYARAANLGIASTYAPIVAVLNPDLVVEKGTAVAMLDAFEHDARAGVIGPQVVDLAGTVYPSARREPGLGTSLGHAVFSLVWPANPWTRRYREERAASDEVRTADWLSGAAMWFRRDALDAVGGWDERYFMFFEDMDVCTRLRAGGWAVVYDPHGRVVHVEGVSRRHHPFRSIVDHHRAALTYARTHWRGPKRALLPLAAAVLAVRAAALVVVARLRGLRT
jgi:N-acetylglucosaminyl-diphospho-decaprenol L-rhamnosyltransferase